MACAYRPTPAPTLPAYRCGRHLVDGSVCDAPLTPVPSADRRDWYYADPSGSLTRDETPPALAEDPAAWWAELAAQDIATYSALKAAVDLACFSWWHLHDPGPISGHDPGPVPEACGQPMWASPDGWSCRVHGTTFPYAPD